MNILWLTWKDQDHPTAGGAELINEELAARLIQDGHAVKFIVANFASGKPETARRGFEIIRLGNRYSVYLQAALYYLKNLRGWPDLIIEEINTLPFLSRLYTRAPKVLFFHQLAREVWFYQSSFPLNWLGYLLEPLFIKLVRGRESITLTVSPSTQKDLQKLGYPREKIKIITEAITLDPLTEINSDNKFTRFTLLSLGEIRPMKQIEDQIKAFELAKQKIPDLQLKIAGRARGTYGREILQQAQKSPYRHAITVLGHVSETKKQSLLRRSHLLLGTSVKEGWGLTITEAASQGTPAVAYNVDGFRDSIQHNQTGLLCAENTPDALAQNIVQLHQDQSLYKKLRKNAWEESKRHTLEKSYADFIAAVKTAVKQ